MADEKKPKQEMIFATDPISHSAMNELSKTEQEVSKKENIPIPDDSSPHLSFILENLRKDESKRNIQHRMAFEIEPDQNKATSGSIYRQKVGLTPDHVLKRITGPQGDDLVNQILQARSNIMASFGRPRTSRFAIGYEFQEISESMDNTPEEAEIIKTKVEKMKEVFWNCGHGGVDEDWHPNLSQWLKMATRDGITFGRIATELLYTTDKESGKEKFHSFRAVDSGTIYRILPRESKDKARRKEALRLLQQIKNKKFDQEKYDKDEYKWVQVINGKPVQVFTDKEMIVYNLYPTTNVDYNGYPLTPIDQALNAIATHINITIHNKLYFEHGRASRGMLVFKSDDIDEGTIQKIRLQFHQSINSVQNSWRMPVFAVGADDDVRWETIDNSGRDKEFQFLSDDTARVILGAFQMSPEELPGYSHLARGSNSQTLSESDNEYQLTAARDVGLRPLMYDIQDLLNTHLFPKFDEELSKSHQFVLAGLEDDSPEKEATRIQQDMGIHMTYDDVLETVEKETVGKELGGDFPLNEAWAAAVAPYMPVGLIMEKFFGVKGASQDPRFNYFRDEYWFRMQDLLMQKAQSQLQMQQMALDQQAGMMGMGQEEDPNAEEGEGDPDEEEDGGEETQKKELVNYMALEKSRPTNHNSISKMILKRHSKIVDQNMKKWNKESEQAIKDILSTVKDKKEE